MHIQGGFYLVSGSTEICRSHPEFPETFYSISNCISDVVPGSWGLSWVAPTQGDSSIIDKLLFGEDQLQKLRIWLDKKFEEELFGWPNVFTDLKTARDFYNIFLSSANGLTQVKLLGVALQDEDAELYLKEYEGYFEKDEKLGKPGNYLCLRRKEEVDKSGHFLGFEILGETFSSFCSFACNGLETDFKDKLGISLNEHGLINTYEEADKAVYYTVSDEAGAEPAFWLPWAIYEYLL